jgi:hypothetical protein
MAPDSKIAARGFPMQRYSSGVIARSAAKQQSAAGVAASLRFSQ